MADSSPLDAGILAARVFGLECEVGRLRETLRLLQENGGPSSVLDAARARNLNAQAERIEQEIAIERAAPPDDGVSPVLARTWTVERSQLGAGEPVLILRLIDHAGRVHQVEMPPNLAVSLSGSLGSMVADILTDAKAR